MKYFGKIVFTALISLLILVSIAHAENESLTVLFTHDLHSYFEPTTLLSHGKKTQTGGFARIKTAIERVKAENPNVIVLDAGDIAMGTLFQTLYTTEAAELRLMGAMGFDVTTLGNHEFDYGTDQLSEMLLTAKRSGDPLPAYVQSNIDWENSNGTYAETLKDAFTQLGAKEYVILQSGKFKIAVFAMLGEDAIATVPNSGLNFLPLAEAAKKIIAKIKENENPDMIICLSHSGTSDNTPSRSEDELLAQAVPEIDLIISGHSHSLLKTPIQHGSTYIASCGEYGNYLGRIDLARNSDGRWESVRYELIPIDPSIHEDAVIVQKIQAFKTKVQSNLRVFGFSDMNQILARNPYEYPKLLDIYTSNKEEPLGNLISDSYIYAIKQAEGNAYIPVDIAVVPAGVIRSSLRVGEVTVADAFEVCSIGIGKDGLIGCPLISFYLNGKEIKKIAEFDAGFASMVDGLNLSWSGLYTQADTNQIIFHKITDLKMMDASGVLSEVEDERLYRIAIDLYAGEIIGNVEKASKGLVKITPKDKDGNPIDHLEDAIIRAPSGAEMKAWVSLAAYLSSFPKNESGVPVIPPKYNAPLGRKNFK